MPRLPIPYAVDAATFAGLSADDFPDGQWVVVTDDDQTIHEARGPDGARTWVQITGGATAGGSAVEVSVDGAGTGGGPFTVTTGTAWQIDADGLARHDPAAAYTTGQAAYAVDSNGLPYLDAL